MNKKITIHLSPKSIQDGIDQLQKFKKEFASKNKLFVERLAEVGIPVIDENIMAADGDSDTTHDTHIKIESRGDRSKATLVVEGSDLLFIEFGAGVYFNGSAGGSPHPMGQEFGYTIGSYGKGYGKQKTWGYYDDNGDVQLSQGTQATMPVYKAGVEIERRVVEIAREVFGG